MAKQNDQTFTVNISLTVQNYGGTLHVDQVEALILRSLDELPSALDYLVDHITVEDDATGQTAEADEFGAIN